MLNSTEIYSLMVSCLKGEASPDDEKNLEQLLVSTPALRYELESLRTLMNTDCNNDCPEHFSDSNYIHEKFDRMTSRLKDEGLL
jgi:hypothetical protein